MIQSERPPRQLREIFDTLNNFYSLSEGWPQGEWPVGGQFSPPQLEVVVGAVLTQNVSWRNVEKAIDRLMGAGLTTLEAIQDCPGEKLS